MANYGYGDNYSTSNYGAQGGAEGGGFVAGGYGASQGGSQDSPGRTKNYGNYTLRPVTIKQLIDSVQPHPDAEFKIDGSEVTQLSFIGQILSISSQTTNITWKVDDGTGIIEVKQWSDMDADTDTIHPSPTDGQYVHVWGRLKSFNNKRHVICDIIRPITDFNAISTHLLEATAVHLHFTRGPPDAANGGGAKGAAGNDMFVDSYGAAANRGSAVAAGAGKTLPARTSAAARKVFALLQSSPQNNEGLHVHNIAAQLSMQANDVFKAGDELLGEGLIYTTVDDETWAILEY